MKNKIVYTVPPKISFVHRVINGKDTKIKIVRNSLICHLTTENETIIFGNTIYARNKIVTQKVFNRALERIKERNRVGTIRYILNVYKTRT